MTGRETSTCVRIATRLTIACVLAAAIGLGTTGCETGAQTGALGGAGIGALAGQAIGGNTTATLVGAGIGAGIGYIIGNEDDKKKAKTMNSGSTTYTHSEVGPLGGSKWQLISLAPQDIVGPYASKTIEFRADGRVITTTTNPDGTIDIYNERYRVVGSTLIVNRADYLINARYQLTGNEMIVDADDFRAVLRRLPS